MRVAMILSRGLFLHNCFTMNIEGMAQEFTHLTDNLSINYAKLSAKKGWLKKRGCCGYVAQAFDFTAHDSAQLGLEPRLWRTH